MTHHDVKIDCQLVEILDITGRWSVFQTDDKLDAARVFDLFANLPGTKWAVWKRPSRSRGYVAERTYGREPDCPNCSAAGCPDEPHPEGCECDGHGVCRYWNAVPSGARTE